MEGDFASGISVDVAGNAYVAGYTQDSDFPLVNPLQERNGASSRPFVAALDATGSSLLYSTYFGGSSGGDLAAGIAADGSGRVYVTGRATSHDFPTANPLQPAIKGGSDAFVARLALKPRVTAPATLPAGRDIPVHGLDLTLNGPFSVYSESTGYPFQGFRRNRRFDRDLRPGVSHHRCTPRNNLSYLGRRPQFRNHE